MKSFERVIFVATLCFCTAFLLVQCKKLTLNSQWASEPVTADGEITEWDSALSYDEDLNVSYGIQNDDHSLYVALVTADQELQRHMMMSGLVLWLDADGGQEKEIGFKFPRGLMERGMPARHVMAAMRNPEGMDEAQFDALIQQNFRDLQIVDARNQNLAIYTLHDAKQHNIQFKLKYSQGRLIYELCLPLDCAGRHPWSIAAATVGLCFETPELDFSPMGRPSPSMTDASGSGSGMRGGGRGGRGGGAGGPGGGMGEEEMGGGMRPTGPQMKNLKVWLTATLAPK
ncbi:hypothetical protein JW998_07885 [candidate division KSB1 bacterium]|nr:hypothetical protein [candidate division KSB1 bacterium]